MKRLCLMLASVFVLGLAVSAFATSQLSNSIQDVIDEKNANLSGHTWNPPDVLVGGETIGAAIPIGVPGASTGNTCDNANDYDEACPYTGSTSGDEVYSVTGVSGRVTFDICDSNYDTKIYVYENAAGNLVACNDDACSDPSGNPFRSIVTCVSLDAASTYYIVVDGYFGDCGDYNLSAYVSAGCPAACDPEICPPGAIAEGEPVCGPDYVDAFNGGCSSNPIAFSPIPCSGTVCGAGGTFTFNSLSYRDTDWYEFTLPVAANVTVELCASFDAQLAAIDGNIGCGFITMLCGPVWGPDDSTLACAYSAPAGVNWIFVATSAFTGVPCGSPYVLTLDCGTTATETTSWGGIKGLYR